MTKQQQLKQLNNQLESIKFKLDAMRLKFKYSKSNNETLGIGLACVGLSIQYKFTLSQIMIVQSQPIPNFKSGSSVGQNRREVIIKKDSTLQEIRERKYGTRR